MEQHRNQEVLKSNDLSDMVKEAKEQADKAAQEMANALSGLLQEIVSLAGSERSR